jgi:uncharacterized protein (TIRG00374 family)
MRQLSTAGGSRLVRIPRWVQISVSVVVLILIGWFILVPQYGKALDALNSLEQIALFPALVAVGLELASLLANSALTASVIGADRPRYITLLRIDLTNLGISHTVPGGGFVAAAARFRLLGLAGVPPADALTAAAIETTGSNLVLGAIFGIGLVLSLTSFATSAYYVVAASAMLALLVGAGLGVWLLTRHTDRAVHGARRLVRHVPLVSEDRAESFVRTMGDQVRELLTDPRRMAVALLLAAASWLLDAAALWLILAAFGVRLNVGALLTVYGLGSILAMLPLTPGGLGIVEGVMVPAFVGLGAPPATALLGVVGWRLLEFWLPMPLGLFAYLSLRLGVLRSAGLKLQG